MTEADGERGGAEQVKDGKHCRDCEGWKRWRSGDIGFDEMAQCRFRHWNPCANHPACDKFREKKPRSDPSMCEQFVVRES